MKVVQVTQSKLLLLFLTRIQSQDKYTPYSKELLIKFNESWSHP